MRNKYAQKKICVVCEGYEEYDYFSKLIGCNVFHQNYNFKLKNARSIDNIFAVYQNEFQNDNFDLIVIFCDTEIEPYSQFKNLIKKIDKFHNKRIAKDIVFFANPCTMQIILSHFNLVHLMSNSKTKNSQLIRRLTGVEEYQAKATQRETIMKQVESSNYSVMKSNLATISCKCDDVPSTNFIELLDKLEQADTTWINKIEKKFN